MTAWCQQSHKIYLVLRSVARGHARVDGMIAWRKKSHQDFLVLKSVAPGCARVPGVTASLAVAPSFPGTQEVGAWSR
jgi:hypothetical protein